MQNSGGPEQSQTRNMILAVVISGAILLGWQFFYEGPRLRKLQAEQARIEEQTRTENAANPSTAGSEPGTSSTPATVAARPREEVLAQSSAARVAIDTPAVDGSIALQGARIDDLSLRNYTRTVDPQSGEVSLLVPEGAMHSFDAFFGWEDRDTQYVGIGDDQVWTAEEGARLTPQTPLVLHYTSPDGLVVTRTIAIDENYMFTITDEVRNTGSAARNIRPFGVVRRQGLPEDYINRQIVHQGFAGAFGPNNHLNTYTYQRANKHAQDRAKGKVGEQERLTEQQGTGGWLGITDHYWLTAIVLDQTEPMSGYFDSKTEGATTDYRAAYRGNWRQLAPGASVSYTQRLFAGAKRVDLLQQYQKGLNITRFDEAVDWGNITYWLTRAYFFLLLHPLAKLIGGIYGFGFAILLSTVVIKLLLFPLVYHSFKSMAKMRAIVPKQKEIQERYAADKARQQQEMIKLYQTEKINPVSGCLPILLQIPVFFALYKTLSVTIEMRHAPFIGWIHDLSAPDPTSIFNLFGLLPYDPHTLPVVGAFLAIGVLPILYGVSMWALQALSPPPPDPTQAQIFRLLPILFTFMFAGFPAGLVLYWTWSNSLSIAQQYVIMRRQGVETQFDKFLARFKKPAQAE